MQCKGAVNCGVAGAGRKATRDGGGGGGPPAEREREREVGRGRCVRRSVCEISFDKKLGE